MICSKCNNEVPAGARFCPNCGALAAAANEGKSYCSNCGLELPKGAKFCAVCGAAAAQSSNAEIKPSSVLEPVTLGAPVSAESPSNFGGLENKVEAVGVAVSENPSFSIPKSDISMPSVGAPVSDSIPEPVSDVVPEPIFAGEEAGVIPEASAVAAEIPSPAESIPSPVSAVSISSPAESIPTPSAGIPAPVSAPSYSSQMGQTAMPSYSVPEANPMPTYSPNANQPVGGFADFGLGGAAAVAVKPVKKKSVLKPILIVLGSLIGAALIAAGVLFFVNKALLFNIVMGNSGYAAYVEGNSIKSVTDNMDPAVIASSIKSASASVAQSMQAMTYGTTVSPMSANSSVSMSSMSNMGTMDWNTALKSYADSIKEVYGTSGVKMSADIKLELTDTAKSMLGENSADTDKILEMLNNSGIVMDMAFEEDAMDMAVELNSGSLKLNAKTVITENGDVYLAFPFASDKAIMMNIGTTTTAAPVEQDVYLELDEKEVKKFMEKLVNIYIDAYKSSEVTVESGELSVGGIVAQGKHIKVNLTGDKLTKLFSDIGEAFKNNDYLVEKFVKFINDCGAPMTEDQFKNSITSLFSMMKVPENCGFVIDTITDNNCNVLAKIYDMVNYGKSTMKIGYIGDFGMSTKNSSTAALSLVFDRAFSMDVTMNKASDTDGTIAFTVAADGFSGTFNVKYSGVKETTYLGKPAYEGTYEISIAMPTDFTQAGNDKSLEILSSMKIILSTKVEGETSNTTMAFDVPQYGKLSVNMAITPEDRSVEIPKNATDLTPYTYMTYDEFPENVKNDILDIARSIRDAVKNQNAGEIGSAIVDALDEEIEEAEKGPSADSGEVGELMSKIFDDMFDVMNFDSTYNNKDAALTQKADALADKFDDLYSEISDKYLDTVSQKDFDAFKARYDALHSEMEALEKEYNKNGSTPTGGNTNSEDVNFNSLSFEALVAILAEYEDRYFVLVDDNGGTDFKGSAKLYGEECREAYEEAVEDFDNLNDVYQAGSLELSLLRKSRKSAKAFAEAVEALESAYNLSL